MENKEIKTQYINIEEAPPEEHHELRTRDKSNIIAWCLAFLIIVASVLKWTSVFTNATIKEICVVGSTCWTLCCAPISLNVTLEKFHKKL